MTQNLGILQLANATPTPAPAAEPGALAAWFQRAFEKFGEISLTGWIAVAALLLLCVGLFVVSRRRVRWTASMLAYAALAIALSFLLSYIRLWRMPQGGSVTAASMLPLMLFAYAFGVAPGLLAGVAYGVMQLMQQSWVLNVWQVLLDYPIAFAMTGLAGAFSQMEKQRGAATPIALGVVLCCFLRFAASVLSGVVFFAEYAPVGQAPFVYSFLYNGAYMLPEAVLTALLGALAGPRVLRVMRDSRSGRRA